jgi:hypothetical protein
MSNGDNPQLSTRVRMLQDLARQRQRLPHTHPRGEDKPPDTGGTIGEPVEAELARLLTRADHAYDTDGTDSISTVPPPPEEG